jgi:hypothetical protein
MRNTFWIISVQNLHQSNAGIGNTFIIAKATDIIPANHRKLRNPRFSNNTCPTLTIATGHDNELIASLASHFLKRPPILFKLSIVRFHSALISFSATSIAFHSGYSIVLSSKSHSVVLYTIPSLQSSQQLNTQSFSSEFSSIL